MSDALERREVLYEGNVQGVGFRFTTNRVAGRFDVAGYVRNLPDGGSKSWPRENPTSWTPSSPPWPRRCGEIFARRLNRSSRPRASFTTLKFVTKPAGTAAAPRARAARSLSVMRATAFVRRAGRRNFSFSFCVNSCLFEGLTDSA
jgi:hypothetical protein